jgi:hypothetical protein
MTGSSSPITRRRFLAAGTVAAGAGAAAAAAVLLDHPARGPRPVALGPQPAGLPSRQHAWNATLARDDHGNPVAPRHDRLLFFDVRGRPSRARATILEAALRSLERRYPWGPGGLLFVIGWGPAYFHRAERGPSPVPAARALSDFELPAIDDYDVCLHIASDSEARLAAVESALTGDRRPGAEGGDLSVAAVGAVLRWRATRTGFTGAGLPAAHQRTGGIPPGQPVPSSAPLFMGFGSGLRHNQASEDAITIPDGPFRGGTTMHVSYMRLRLDSWYRQLSQDERVARMYGPQVTPREAAALTTDAPSHPQLLGQAIRRYGVVGHAQASARARRHGRPIILRRDFNTVDGDQAGLHFVSLQRSIDDFVRTRTAMNASSAQLQNPAITDTVNNGINDFIFVLRRGNYLVPPRSRRAFPLAVE